MFVFPIGTDSDFLGPIDGIGVALCPGQQIA